MEKIELKKKLEKKKAYLVFFMILLTLSTPTFLGLCRELNFPFGIQASVLGGILVIITLVYKKMNQVRVQIRTLFR